MPEQRVDTIFNYWGKADPAYPIEQKWHPLAGHQGVM
jgi:CRISPR-associated endonuclease/helicase Cas3